METATTTLRHRPALDGLRGLAVVAVLLYHHDRSLPGGFLGVSAFFTLSGFLITWLLATEHRATGHLDLRRFWSRRARRLLPASWVALLGILVLGAGTGLGADRLVGDVWAALANVANWRFVLDGSSYGSLFEDPSPVAHYWSLAIEEQLYLVLPLVLGVVLGRRNLRLAVVAALIGASVAVGVVVGGGDRAYQGTDTRAAEVLIGAFAALVVSDPRFRPGRWSRRAAVVAGPAALALIGGLWATTSLTDPRLHRGLLVAHAAATVAVIAAGLVSGPVQTALSSRPLVAVGRVSYGLYLFHWPVFLWLDAARTGLDGWALLALRVAVSGAAAAVSYVAIEQPIRIGRVLRRPARATVAAATGAVTVVAAVVLVPVGDTVSTSGQLAAASAALETAERPTVPDTRPAGTVGTEPDRSGTDAARPGPLRVAVFGDSTALMTASGLHHWATRHPDRLHVTADARLGCPVARGGQSSFDPGQPADVLPVCNDRDRLWRQHLDANPADVVVLQYGPWDVGDRRLPGDDTWRHIGDPVYDQQLTAEMHAAVDVLAAAGAEVVWLTAPHIEALAAQRAAPGRAHPSSDDARMDRFNELLRGVAEARPAEVRLVDLAGYLTSHPDGAPGGRLRPDGIHFTGEAAAEIASDWLADQVIPPLRG